MPLQCRWTASWVPLVLFGCIRSASGSAVRGAHGRSLSARRFSSVGRPGGRPRAYGYGRACGRGRCPQVSPERGRVKTSASQAPEQGKSRNRRFLAHFSPIFLREKIGPPPGRRNSLKTSSVLHHRCSAPEPTTDKNPLPAEGSGGARRAPDWTPAGDGGTGCGPWRARVRASENEFSDGAPGPRPGRQRPPGCSRAQSSPAPPRRQPSWAGPWP